MPKHQRRQRLVRITRDSTSGLGISVDVLPDGTLRVTAVRPDGPAARGGDVFVGDRILSINGLSRGREKRKRDQLRRCSFNS